MTVFISHISEESALAAVLKKWIESIFIDQCAVFVSSDLENIPAGSKWLDEIDKALDSSSALIVLCSPKSLGRPWVNFETGCGWIKRVPIIPICHSGQKKGNLPAPFSMFQGLEIEAGDFVQSLFNSLAKHLSVTEVSNANHSKMVEEVKKAVGFVAKSIEAPASKRPGNEPPKSLHEVAVKILTRIAVLNGVVERSDIFSLLMLSPLKVDYYAEILEQLKYININVTSDFRTLYRLTKEGRDYLIENDLL